MARSFVKGRRKRRTSGNRTRDIVNQTVIAKDAAFRSASIELSDIITRSTGWGTRRHALLADAIIGVCARCGVPVETVITNFLRRSVDAQTIAAIKKRVAFLARKNKK